MSKLLKKYKGYEGTAEIDTTELVCFGKIVCIDDLVTYQADSPAGLQREFEAAVDDYLETCKMLGREPKKAFSGLFNVRVTASVHSAAVSRALEDGTTLNAVVALALEKYLALGNEAEAAPPVSASSNVVVSFQPAGFAQGNYFQAGPSSKEAYRAH